MFRVSEAAGNQSREQSFQRRNAVPAARDLGFKKVSGYRLYGLDGVDKVASGEWFEAEDDETAIEVAKTLMDGHDCELWQGRRLVARLPRRREG